MHDISRDNTGWIQTQDNINIINHINMSMNNSHNNNNYRRQSTSPTKMSHYQQNTQSAKFRTLKTQGNQLQQSQDFAQNNTQSRSKFRETMRFKNFSQIINVHKKKFSLDIKNTNKVNFNFNNLNNINSNSNSNSNNNSNINNNRRQIQLTKHIKMKNKTYRPYSSSSYNHNSHKIIKLQKNNHQNNQNNNKYTQKRIIHSKNNNNQHSYQNNQNQNDKLMSLLNQTKNLFLKTKTMNYWTGKRNINNKNNLNKINKINNKNNQNINHNNKSYSDIKIKQSNQQVNNKQTNKSINNNFDINKQISRCNNINITKQTNKSNNNPKSNQQHNANNNSNNKQNNFLQQQQHQNQHSDHQCTINQLKTLQICPQQLQINQQLFQTPINKKYQNDYQLLQKMLKYQSKNILDSQLHSYLTHMKNKYQSTFYYSSAIFNKVKPKKSNNYIFNMNKKEDNEKQYENVNSPVKKLKQIKNNTSLHYAPLSASRHKKQFMSTSLSYNNNQQKVYNL